MKRYWDYPEIERAKLTREQITEMLRLELMEHGKLMPVEPVQPDFGEPVLIPTQRIYTLVVPGPYSTKDVVSFSTREAAEVAAKLPIVTMDYDYSIGSDYRYSIVSSAVGIVESDVFDKAVLAEIRPALSAIKERKEAYNKLVKEYQDELKASHDICSKVWEDWYMRLEDVDLAKRVADVFEQYTADCDGNRNVAWKFLVRAFDEKQARKAFAVRGITVPVDEPAASDSAA